MGNIDDMQSNNNAFSIIEGRLNEYLNQGARIVTLGGDHSITLPIIRAYGKNIRPLDIMQIDAHPIFMMNWTEIVSLMLVHSLV